MYSTLKKKRHLNTITYLNAYISKPPATVSQYTNPHKCIWVIDTGGLFRHVNKYNLSRL